MRSGAGVYVHLPFCSSICPYCDFAVVRGDSDRRLGYVDSLVREIRMCSGSVWPAFVESDAQPIFDTIFLGGGTPSLMQSDQIGLILEELIGSLDVVEEPWIAMEANPEDVTPAALSSWKGLGIDYLSLGVQSFDQDSLDFLGRRHSPKQARESILLAREAGIHTVSLDLIYCLPGQTPKSWRAELGAAAGLEPDHLSCYQLTVEPDTAFAVRERQGRLSRLPEQDQASLFFETHRTLEALGYVGYEVSNFAADPSHRSRHNQKYWTHGVYLGVGASAHSFSGRWRWWNHPRLSGYRDSIDSGSRPILDNEFLDQDQLCLEVVALGLRTTDGVSLEDLPGGMGTEIWRQNENLLNRWIEAALVEADSKSIRPTLEGMAVADTLSRELHIPIG